MPYSDTCPCPTCTLARSRYSVDVNRANYVTATEHGANDSEAADYAGRIDAYNPPPASAWLANHRANVGYESEECDCGDCESCGYAENNGYSFDETYIPPNLLKLPFQPLARILRRGGRYWSTEVEVNGIDSYDAARTLGLDTEGYSYKATEAGTIVATDDCTCDAEIKIGKMRDGATMTARALQTYIGLRDAGAGCGYNTGHHVHVDAGLLVQEGADAVEQALRASLTLASACNPTLLALATSGYPSHRDERGAGYAGSLKDSTERSLGARTAWHASNAHYVAHNGTGFGGIPTFEYRLPNGTLEPVRAHAHIAVALGLLDFGQRYTEGDTDAHDYYRQATDRLAHSRDWNDADGAAILTRALHLHSDSLTCLSITARTSPASPQTANIFEMSA